MMKTVVITDLRTPEAREAQAYLREQGYEVVSLPEGFPLWREAELSAWAEQVRENLYAVIHPAPPLFQSSLLETTEEEFARARDEGPVAAWCVTKVFGGILREKGEGCFLFLNSVHAEKPLGKGFLFSAGCGAVQMLSREISQDYGLSGVRSYFIQRGPSQGDPDGRNDLSPMYYGLEHRYSSRRIPEPGALKELIAFLLTPAAALLTGSDLRADDGLTMYYGQRISEEEALALQARARREKEVTILGKE